MTFFFSSKKFCLTQKHPIVTETQMLAFFYENTLKRIFKNNKHTKTVSAWWINIIRLFKFEHIRDKLRKKGFRKALRNVYLRKHDIQERDRVGNPFSSTKPVSGKSSCYLWIDSVSFIHYQFGKSLKPNYCMHETVCKQID